MPSRLVSRSTSPGCAPPLRSSRSGCAAPIDRQAVLRLRIADRVAARERAAGLADLGRGAGEDRGEDLGRQVLGEGRDRQREQHAAAHREHVGQCVRRGDLAVRPRVVDERREEVERADDRELVGDPIRSGVVGRGQPGDQGVVMRCGRVRAKPAQGIGEQVGAQLRRAPAAVGQIGQPQSGSAGEGVAASSSAR